MDPHLIVPQVDTQRLGNMLVGWSSSIAYHVTRKKRPNKDFAENRIRKSVGFCLDSETRIPEQGKDTGIIGAQVG